jgi:hypothetical protein
MRPILDRRHAWIAALAVALIVAAVGCSRATPIPAGAQRVRIVLTDAAVRLEPATVRAGDVYLILDAPSGSSISFVEQKSTAQATPGPLSDADLARLARGDTQGTSIGGMDAGGCSPEQAAQDRGMLGPCGNVMHVVLAPGKYAIVNGMPELDPAGGPRPQIAVLEVRP